MRSYFYVLPLILAAAHCDPKAVIAEPICVGKLVVANWYAIGRKTASGEPFNPNGLTAAHRSLAFGSKVQVTNPRNGKSVTVVVNDRGPYARGVTIDLARGAAREIDMKSKQTVCMLEL
jgi:rare lipoprotein A